MEIAIDFGITNTDILVSKKTERIYSSIQSEEINNDFLKKIFDLTNIDPNKIKKIAVTGGKSADLNNTFKDIPIFKVNEVEAIGVGAKNLYSINDEKFVVISAGTGTGCVFYDGKNYHYLGGISIGGGTLQGLSSLLISTSDINEIEKLSNKGNRKNVDHLIGEVVNDIGSLNPNITASNFAKAKGVKNHKPKDIAASLTNMIGEVIGTTSYLNAMLVGVDKVYFIGRLSLSEAIKEAIDQRLKLANINGIYKENREYGNVLGALACIQTK